MTDTERAIRIGGAAGYWGDSQFAPRQLVMQGDVDYLVFDYLAEVTMSILVRARAKSDDLGYARDFVELVMKPLLPEIKARGIRVIANAGGVNVQACARALAKAAEETGIELSIGTVEGDDLLGRMDDLRTKDIKGMFDGADLPAELASANAYFGAFPIAAALDAGADVVITGRCVDSAVTLGPLVHEFGWGPEDYDKLASGTIAGHIIECGAQATGGNFTDWQDVAADWSDMGYPIAVCRADGSFDVTKPQNTGGLVSRLTVGEQVLYEIGNPAAYIVPDVVCDLTNLEIAETGDNVVTVTGIKGRPPTPTFKVSSTYRDGYRATANTVITGFDAVKKARRFAEALLERTRRLFGEHNWGDYRATAVNVIGAETLWGGNARVGADDVREVNLRIDVRHDAREALELFSKETTGVSLSMTTGRCSGGAAGRPKITPVVAQFAFLIDKADAPAEVRVDGKAIDLPALNIGTPDTLPEVAAPDAPDGVATAEVPLIALAVARSGDKGNDANVGVIARKPEYLPWIRAALTPENVAGWFAHNVEGEVRRYDLPGLKALNFYLTQSLGGGGTSSMHLDTQAKTYGQQILAMPIPVPAEIAAEVEAHG